MFQPTTFGKYFLTRRIAVGGMAEIYAAKLYGADGFEKDLVIKLILPQYANDPEFVQSFVAEAKIAVGLTHANIVAIYELGRVDGTYFISMEFVDGLDAFGILEAARRHGLAVPVGCAARVVEEVAQGLDYAHRRRGPDGQPLGLVHRDLNPRNVLVSRDGDVKILDFGIAKTAPGVTDMPKTRAGVVKGTTGYMSPEQAVGHEIDARTDIYQAGLLLHELLTSQALFWRPDDEETRSRMREHLIVAPSVRRPEVPHSLDKVVLTALARDPNERYPTAGALALALREARKDCTGPDDSATLGELVCELTTREADALARASSDNLPSTRDFAEVISQAIEQSITGQIETFARNPRLPDVVSVPTTGSTPLASGLQKPPAAPQVLLTSNGDLVASAAPATTPEPTSVQAPAPALPERPNSGGGAPNWGLVSSLVLLVALAIAGFSLRSARQSAQFSRSATTIAVSPTPEELSKDAGPAPTATATPGPAKTTTRPPSTPPAPKSRPVRRLGVVDFGTRSCSSRVTVDARVVTRTTPSFGHAFAAGNHTVRIEGINCPAVERPGSLQRVQPTVAGIFNLPVGGALKIIADFDTGQLVVRQVHLR